jgi:hypothetical protein
MPPVSCRRPPLIPALTLSLGLLLATPGTGCAGTERLWSVFAYGGQWTDTRFVHIIFRGRTEFHSSYVWVAGVSRQIYPLGRHLASEGELNVARHSGLQHHLEWNSAVLLRWRTFPWDRYVNTTLAYGLGLSYAQERPAIEEQPHRRAVHTLLSMPAELTFAPPSARGSPWEGMLRIHHRSGAFGVVRDAGGSNFLSLGVRYRF